MRTSPSQPKLGGGQHSSLPRMRSPELEYGNGAISSNEMMLQNRKFQMPSKAVTPNLASGRQSRIQTPNYGLSPNVKAHREYNNISALDQRPEGTIVGQLKPQYPTVGRQPHDYSTPNNVPQRIAPRRQPEVGSGHDIQQTLKMMQQRQMKQSLDQQLIDQKRINLHNNKVSNLK